MTPNGKSTWAKVIVAVAGAIIIGLISMVIASQSRITAVEVRVLGTAGHPRFDVDAFLILR